MPQAPEHADIAFAHALANGEREAVVRFEAQYRRVIRHALGVAIRRWKPESPVEPEDFVQDFIGFLFTDRGRRLRSFEGRSSFGGWLYTVALRHFQRALSKLAKDRRSEVVLTRLPEREERRPDHLAAVAADAERLRAVVGQLPERDRLYVRLFYVEGLNASEVARTLGKRPSAVRMHKMRLLERLRVMLDEPPEETTSTRPEATRRRVGEDP
ncbi:MAG: RNA polymerase sigma factor [Bradymonadia bacterium]